MTHNQMPKTTFGLVDVCKGWREQKNTHKNSRKRDCCNYTHCIFYFPMLQILFQGTYFQRFRKKLIKNIRENIGKHKLKLKKLRKTWKSQQPEKLYKIGHIRRKQRYLQYCYITHYGYLKSTKCLTRVSSQNTSIVNS